MSPEKLTPVTTGADGRFEFPVISGFDDRFSLALTRDGYVDEQVGLWVKVDADSGSTFSIVVSACLRPSEPTDVQALKRIGGKVRWAGTGPGDPVVEIILADNEVTDLSLSSLKDVPTLRHLRLEGPNLTDVLLRHLMPLANLETLDLVGTHYVTDAGIEDLRRAQPRLNVARR